MNDFRIFPFLFQSIGSLEQFCILQKAAILCASVTLPSQRNPFFECFMKHKPHQQEKKILSATGLLHTVRCIFEKIPRAVKRQTISLADCLMSALAMFGMKSSSLLAFDGPKLEETVQHNLKTLYQVNHPPSDTHMREVLDEPEPITKQDGATKNDCERNACHRFLLDLKKEHPRLNLTICSDALSATAPHINELKELGYNFIIVVKPEGNRTLYEWVKGIK